MRDPTMVCWWLPAGELATVVDVMRRLEPRFVLERLTDSRAATLVEPLLQEYVKWVAARLAADLGLHFEEADLERHHAYFRAEVPKLLGPRGRLLVARRAGELVGVGALKPVDTEMAEIKRMYVRPIARGSGVGRAILERLLADARDEVYRVVRLETLGFMLEAHALYRSVGFVDTLAFDGSEAAISGLANLPYYMELEL
jgi:GNAT superfamily N-acetyltransferase